MIFISKKVKISIYNWLNIAAGIPTASIFSYPCITIFTNGKAKIDTCNRFGVGRKVLAINQVSDLHCISSYNR